MRIGIDVDLMVREIRKSQITADSIDKYKYSALLKEVAELTYKWSQIYVPVATGNLKSLGHVRGSTDMFYVEYMSPYAPHVHELMYLKHSAPYQAKFLEQGFRMAMMILIRKYGRENIPDFNVRLYVLKDKGVQLFITGYRNKTDRSLSWRRFV